MARRLPIAFVVAVLACGPGAAQPLPPPGATACSGCHGAGGALPPLAGMPAPDIAAAMRAYRSGERPATVMDRIAKGFSDEEVQAMAQWLSAQR
jgi:cytochrome c553